MDDTPKSSVATRNLYISQKARRTLHALSLEGKMSLPETISALAGMSYKLNKKYHAPRTHREVELRGTSDETAKLRLASIAREFDLYTARDNDYAGPALDAILLGRVLPQRTKTLAQAIASRAKNPLATLDSKKNKDVPLRFAIYLSTAAGAGITHLANGMDMRERKPKRLSENICYLLNLPMQLAVVGDFPNEAEFRRLPRQLELPTWAWLKLAHFALKYGLVSRTRDMRVAPLAGMALEGLGHGAVQLTKSVHIAEPLPAVEAPVAAD